MRPLLLFLCASSAGCLLLSGFALTRCGDGITNPTVEECDDGNNNDDDGCNRDCQFEPQADCGNSVPEAGEACDDGNNTDGDGCSSLCQVELLPECGNGVLEAGEECDDGNTTDGDGCSQNCLFEGVPVCGNGATEGAEECDDGNTLNNDGCDASCSREIVQLATGDFHSCALFTNGTVKCWGEDNEGRLADLDPADNNIGDIPGEMPPAPVDIGGSVAQLTAGDEHTCALLSSGGVKCWGNGALGRLGYGNEISIGDNEPPSSVGEVNLGGVVIQIDAGDAYNCALLENGNVKCWGSGASGQLGYGDVNNLGDAPGEMPPPNVSVGGFVTQIATAQNHACVLLSTGDVRCWGASADGELGQGNTATIGDDEPPSSVGVVDIGGQVLQISTAERHSCALLASGNIRCWGSGDGGRLGYGNVNNLGDNEPPAVAGDVLLGGIATQVIAGDTFTCAILANQSARCWGRNGNGQLGYGNTDFIGDNEPPSTAGDLSLGDRVVQIATGSFHACALLASGVARCWGDGTVGQIGAESFFDIGDDELPSQANPVPLF